MGKWKAIIPIILALVIATGGSIFVYRWLKVKTVPRDVARVEKGVVSIVVAATNLPWGTKLTKEMIKQAPFLQESLPAGVKSDVSSLEGRVLISALSEKEPILETRLAPVDVTVGGVSAVVRKGKRAIAVKGDKVIGISGFIQPGNRVDVLVTLEDPEKEIEVTKLVLENIPVLATGTEIQDKGKGEPSPVDVYTLEVDPEQGEKLALAATLGKLQFALRNVMDGESVVTRGATIPTTLASLRGEEPAKPAEVVSKRIVRRRPAAPSYVTVEVIRGDKVAQQKLSR
jgi:pilus assembly protein CpaB